MNSSLDSDQVWVSILKAFEHIFQFLQLPLINLYFTNVPLLEHHLSGSAFLSLVLSDPELVNFYKEHVVIAVYFDNSKILSKHCYFKYNIKYTKF